MYKLMVLVLCGCHIQGKPKNPRENLMHPYLGHNTKDQDHEDEKTSDFWTSNAAATLMNHLGSKENRNLAKNIILFLGDGMSIPTLAATRVFLGDENVELSFEKFPYTALSKTYCVDSQVADSACTATAYLGGVKTNIGTIGVTANVEINDCEGMTNTSNHVHSIAKWAQDAGKSTGIVTTARLTDASPVGVYGHTSQRNWETDTDVTNTGQDPTKCLDLATQLITQEVGKNLNIILGGGRGAFLSGDEGERSDGRNLIDEWQILKKDKPFQYIENREQLLGLSINETDYVLGLFAKGHCPYDLERGENDPSLTEMTETAIELLSKNTKGYFLYVEGARIDMAHHGAMAHLALGDTAEFSRAIERAVNLTSERDTLIVVTSDHAHTMSISGYPERGSNILGLVGNQLSKDNLTFTILNYGNGPGYGNRHNLTEEELSEIEYQFSGSFPLDSETHGGDDVMIFARGPWSHLFHGVVEQNVIPHFMAYASCVGNNPCGRSPNSGSVSFLSILTLSTLTLFQILI